MCQLAEWYFRADTGAIASGAVPVQHLLHLLLFKLDVLRALLLLPVEFLLGAQGIAFPRRSSLCKEVSSNLY